MSHEVPPSPVHLRRNLEVFHPTLSLCLVEFNFLQSHRVGTLLESFEFELASSRGVKITTTSAHVTNPPISVLL